MLAVCFIRCAKQRQGAHTAAERSAANA